LNGLPEGATQAEGGLDGPPGASPRTGFRRRSRRSNRGRLNAVWFVLARLARDRSALLGLLLIAGLVVSALLAPVLATHPDDVFELHPAERLRAPGAAHWLGTDPVGAGGPRPLLLRARLTILIGVIAVGASLLV